MTKNERQTRFDVALEIVNGVYTDYCKDEKVTREQANEFCQLIQDMIRFSLILGGKLKNGFGYKVFYKDNVVSANRGYDTYEEALEYVNADLNYFNGKKDESGEEYQKQFFRHEIFEVEFEQEK